MRLLNKTQMNFAYGMGAAVVIIGALMKITHFSIGFLTGNVMLTIGLVTEAIFLPFLHLIHLLMIMLGKRYILN